MLDEISRNDTFRAVVAARAERVVGFVYGYSLPTDHGWWNDFPGELPADLTQEWAGRTFAVIDLAVDSDIRKQGVGRQLLAELFHHRPEQRAVLSVQPTATAAHGFYARLGWTLVGRKGPMRGVDPPCWDIYLRPIDGQGR